MPTDDIHIRKMLAWAMDYKSVIEILEPGSGKARGPIPDIIPGQNAEVFQYYMDLDKAREEMKQSKYYPKIPPIELVTPSGNETRRKIALVFQENLAKLGVTLNLRQEPWGRIVDLAKTPETTPHLTGISVGSYYPDPDAYLYSMYHSKSAGSWASTEWLQDPVVDKLLDQQRGTLDAKKRASILNELQRIIVDKCPDVFVYVEPLRVGVQKYLKGFTPRPVSNYYLYFHDWWFEKK
jgi:peptide/nickel transport system substrate-binding protein